MCGFTALIGNQQRAEALSITERMLNSIVHRGPDDSGVLQRDGGTLGFRRLSILDLSSASHQPMESESGDYAIVFNGEIYNYVELRRELQALGHSFQSNGDTEVLLKSYIAWGPACLDKLNGMWAFVIHDRRRQVFFGARDRFGMKPLFRWSDGHRTLLASEIKALRASGLVPTQMNLERVATWLYRNQCSAADETFYANIHTVKAGHAFEIDGKGRYKEWAYWDLDRLPSFDDPEAGARFRDLFEDAMRLHMRSDVAVGVNLSGGLDSTSILCAAARLHAQSGSQSPLLAFAYSDAKFDESTYVKATIALTGARLVPLELSPLQLWQSLPEVLRYQDEPVHTMTAVVSYHLSALARSHGVKVVLNGQGADESLAGYPSYFHNYWYELCASREFRRLKAQIDGYVGMQGGDASAALRSVVLQSLRARLRNNGLYRALALRADHARAAQRDWINPDLLRHLRPPAVVPELDLRTALKSSIRQVPLPLYIRIEDRNSMAHSVEARLPFLDYRLVEFALALPAHRKLQAGWNKLLLREAMRDRIPEVVRSRVDKMGFPVASSEWFRGPLYQHLREVFTDPSFMRQDLVDPRKALAALDDHKQGRIDDAPKLFSIAQLHLWRQSAGV